MDKLETFWIRHILPFCEKQRGESQTDRNDFILHLFRHADDDTSNTCSKFSEQEEADDDEGVAREQRE